MIITVCKSLQKQGVGRTKFSWVEELAGCTGETKKKLGVSLASPGLYDGAMERRRLGPVSGVRSCVSAPPLSAVKAETALATRGVAVSSTSYFRSVPIRLE